MIGIKSTFGMIIKLVENATWKEHVIKAFDTLQNGGVIALPTDTLYGLAAKVDNSTAIQKIYDIKSRSSAKPLAICSPDIQTIRQLSYTDHIDNALLNTLLPGPVTLILKRRANLNSHLNPGIPLVGVRIPDNKFIQHICREIGPLALTSANKSEQTSPLSIYDFQDIWDNIDTIFDGGNLQLDEERLGSTVVDLSEPKHYKIIRPGCALAQTIELLEKHNIVNNR